MGKKNGDIQELKFICLALDASCEELNPDNFVNCRFAYLDNLKNYYFLEIDG